jgi:hypothetical protein
VRLAGPQGLGSASTTALYAESGKAGTIPDEADAEFKIAGMRLQAGLVRTNFSKELRLEVVEAVNR